MAPAVVETASLLGHACARARPIGECERPSHPSDGPVAVSRLIQRSSVGVAAVMCLADPGRRNAPHIRVINVAHGRDEKYVHDRQTTAAP